MATIGIVDTTFSRVDMGALAEDEIRKFPELKTVRRTVPGVKDLPAECLRLLREGADICIAMGMVGAEPIDKQCGHEASLAIQGVQLMTGKHVLEVFVHANEGRDEKDLYSLFENRSKKHALNAVRFLLEPEWFTKHAGQGLRQGREDEGPLKKLDSQA
ncbi:riboflavin synthase [Candidatus Micrarchaeota archaeon]|nr:riboflavin synthase [Candidatus Micrarchaeota archaeon]